MLSGGSNVLAPAAHAPLTVPSSAAGEEPLMRKTAFPEMISSPSSAARSSVIAQVASPKKVGSIWLHEYNGKPWPIVLCDDITPPEVFMKSRPSGHVLPAILLGKVIYIWVVDRHLQEFDPTRGHSDNLSSPDLGQDSGKASAEDQLESERCDAFRYHAILCKPPAFWKNFIERRSEARSIERKIDRKRKCISTAGDRGPRKRRDFFISARGRGSKGNGEWNFRPPQSERAKNLQAVKNNPAANHLCTIFVGEAQEPFVIPLEACGLLADRVIFTEEMRNHIDLSKEFDITAEDFAPVAKYLRKSEFTPRLIESDTRQWLEQIVSAQERDRAAIFIAKTYRTAGKLRFGELQHLCIKKLKALKTLSSRTLLAVAGLVMSKDILASEAGKEDWRWIGNLIAKRRDSISNPIPVEH